MKINGETWYQWARRHFEFENCSECGKGVRGHMPAIVLGNWFALCKKPEPAEGSPEWIETKARELQLEEDMDEAERKLNG